MLRDIFINSLSVPDHQTLDAYLFNFFQPLLFNQLLLHAVHSQILEPEDGGTRVQQSCLGLHDGSPDAVVFPTYYCRRP